jgi:hypothetical protein
MLHAERYSPEMAKAHPETVAHHNTQARSYEKAIRYGTTRANNRRRARPTAKPSVI